MLHVSTSIIWGGVAAATVTAIAAVGSAFISKSVKISEFRQAWINSLRDDIAEYIVRADEWVDVYVDLNSTAGHLKGYKQSDLSDVRYKVLTLLHRIELRLNFRERTHEELYPALSVLVEPGQIPPDRSGILSRSNWENRAIDARRLARTTLKREWEVTKHPWRIF